jgi:predicted nucleotidyltransferase
MNHIEATEEFIRNYFKDSIFVLVAGSVIRGEATITSDLDIFIIKNDIHKAYRESFFESDWPIEAFIHTQDSYKDYFMGDIKRRRPSIP